MQRRDEKVVLSSNPAVYLVYNFVITLLLIAAQFSMTGLHSVPDADACHVYSLHYGAQRLNQSKLFPRERLQTPGCLATFCFLKLHRP